MNKAIIVGVLYLLAVNALCFISTGSILSYYDIPSLLFVLFVALLSVYGNSVTEQTVKARIELFGHGAFIGGFIACLCGVVAVLTNLSDPSSLGPAFSVTVLGLLYGLVLKGLCFIIGKKLDN